MAATDGDSANLIDTSLAQVWNGDDSRVETHAVQVSTGTGGAGTATVSYNEAFENGTVFPFATADTSGATATVTSAGASQATVDVTGGPASSTLVVYLLVVGPQNR